ncbi:MAG: hypothetical protein V3R93_03995, partial [Candidatus Hydrothermarchaeaceae archaeon]
MVFGRKKKKEDKEEEVVLLSDDEYDAEADLQKQIAEEKEYEVRMLADEEKAGATDEKKLTVEDLLLKTEKIEGKLASFEEAKGRIDDRIMRVSEQVGELRSMVLEREKSFGLLEADFGMIKDVFEDIKPSEFAKELDKKERSILENGMHIEKIENLVERLSEDVAGFRKTMEKIKSFENLVDIANEVSEKLVGIDETGKYTKRLAAKTESIFGELNKQIMSLEDYKSKIEQTSELTNEMVRSIDDLAVKLGTSVNGEELRNSLKDLEDTLTKKFAASESLGDKFESISKSTDFLEKRVRIMELDKVSFEVGEKIKELSPGLKQMRRIEHLTRERKDILDLLKNTEEEYKNEAISEEAYKEIKGANEKKLNEIKAIIREDLQSLETTLEAELGPLISRGPRGLKEAEVKIEAKVPVAKVKEAPAPQVSLDDRIAEEMGKMKIQEPDEEVEVEAKPAAAIAHEEAVSPADFKNLSEKLKLMETEEGTIRNLLKGLATSSMKKEKRLQMEKKYTERLNKITADIAEVRKLKESAPIP